MSWIRTLDNGRFQAIYRDGRKRQRARTFNLKKDAQLWLANQKVDLSTGRWSDPRDGAVLFADYVKKWQAGREVEASTDASDAGRIKNHLVSAFGVWPLASIRYLDVLEWMQTLKRKGLKPKTRRECLALMKMILDAAVIEGRIPANPASAVKPPPKVAPTKRKVTRGEVDTVLAKASTGMTARLAVAAYAGLRWGETCGLRWGNVDLTRHLIAVVETMEEINGHFNRKLYTKDREDRTVPLAAELVEILIDHKAAWLVRGGMPNDDDLVFPSRAGTPMYRRNNSRAMAGACKAAGVRSFSYKDLRAFCASYLINERGVPVTAVRELLGHSKASMTLDVYTDPPTDWHEAVVTAFARPL